MPHPVISLLIFSDSEGLLFFGACAVVAVAVVVIEEWPTIKETYHEVRARRRQRMMNGHHRRHYHDRVPVDESLTASGIHEPLQQEMTMRARNVVCRHIVGSSD